MRVGIFGNNYQSDKQIQIRRVFEQLADLGADVWVEKEFFQYLSAHFDYEPTVSGLIENSGFGIDIALSIGGDGTFLRTAALIGRRDIPILGINTGRLGFLADVGPVEIEDTLKEVFKNHYKIEERSVLELKTDIEIHDYAYALNEIAIQKRDTSSMINIRVHINGEYLTNYLADGLIVSTPTGSTGYSISVNGPIIAPQTNNIVLSPIAPHSLNVRPLVIPEESRLSFEVETRSLNFLIAVDGRSENFVSGTKFSIQKADYMVKIIKRYNHTFYKTLRDKLMWGADSRV